MLIILPPSESKRPAPHGGATLKIDQLSFPALTPMRTRVLDALIDTSSQPDALERLLVSPNLGAEVARNTHQRAEPARPALEIYTGSLYAGLDAGTLGAQAMARAAERLVIASSLWGLLRPADRIPAYRLHVCARLVGMDRLEPAWRTVLPAVLNEAAGPQGVVLDLRSPAYQAIGKPTGISSRTVTLRVLPEAGGRTIGDVIAKRIRGQVARHLLETDVPPNTPDELVDVLNDRWPARLDPPEGRTGAWTVRLRPRD